MRELRLIKKRDIYVKVIGSECSLEKVGSNITAPLINPRKSTSLSGFAQLLNLFGGGGFKRASIFSVGISPYITAQIIIQILSNDIVKKLTELRRAGEMGRMKIELYTRLLTLPFAIITSVGTLYLLNNEDLISKKGLGNGTSLIIASGIISSIPENFYNSYNYFSSLEGGVDNVKLLMNIFKFIIYIFFYVLVIALMVFITGTVRKIPIQQTGAGMILQKEKLGYLPIKLMPVGIMPVVFAGSIMIFPVGIAELTKSTSPTFNSFIQDYVSFGSPTGLLIYFLLIVLFSFLYSQIQLNTEEMCRSFQKTSQFIPGIMIGQETHNYIRSVLNKINWLGAPLLGLEVEIKTEENIQIMRVGGLIWQSIKNTLSSNVKVGMILKEVEEIAQKEFQRYGVESSFDKQDKFPSIICLSLNRCVVHGPASDQIIKEGDKLTVDLGFKYRGFNIDGAFSLFFDSAEKSMLSEIEEYRYLNQLTLALFYESIRVLKGGDLSGTITDRMERFFKKYFPKKYCFLEKFTGHGIGRELHDYPRIHNYGKNSQEGVVLPSNSTICIEPMIVEGKDGS
ncbi:hypothetical protein PVNG_02453 [Plasmodium vivax North Korean]|uniref:Peptidase M24 domain-containing protein n=1 Tax=Plasmodium vivax North Korean TaxID=1035514 RepID=A0A0J9TKT8_PLAVI|nr:hypothetical protein PVNG_02453 [Plasmodium vivax North Korean]